jgi:serine/threonine-protein phosphatase 2A regulatory subunit A
MIKQLSDGRHEDYFLYHLFPMVKRLALWDNYTSKISAAALMPMTYEKLSDRDRPSLRTLIVELGKDDTPMVRRAIAQILPELCDIYEQEYFLSELQPMLYMFLADDIDSVKMKALEAVPKFGELVDSDELNNVLIEFVLKMDPDKKNWRVRYHLPDAIIGLSRRLGKFLLL